MRCYTLTGVPAASTRDWPRMTRAELDAFGASLERVAAERAAMTKDDMEALLDRLETDRG